MWGRSRRPYTHPEMLRVNVVPVRLLNRAAVVVQPREPFLSWLRFADSDGADLALADLRRDPSIYLLPECDDDEALAVVLERKFQEIFEDQLRGWIDEPDLWPDPLTFDRFRDWFDISFHSMVADLVERPIRLERC